MSNFDTKIKLSVYTYEIVYSASILHDVVNTCTSIMSIGRELVITRHSYVLTLIV